MTTPSSRTYRGDLSGEANSTSAGQTRTFRLLLGMASLATAVIGVIHRTANSDAVDPVWTRISICVMPLAIIVLSFRNKTILKYLAELSYAYLYIFFTWILFLVSANRGDPNYVIGLLLALAVIGMGFTVRLVTLLRIGIFFGYLVAVSTIVLLNTPPAHLNPTILFIAVAGLSATIFYVAHMRVQVEEDLAERTEQLREANALLEERVATRTQDLKASNQRLRTELTERRRIEEALRRSEARLAEAHRVARLGYWECDLRSGTSFWSDEIFPILNIERGNMPPGIESFLRLMHLDDQDEIQTALMTMKPGDSHECTVRIQGSNGTIRHVRTTTIAEPDDNGHIARYYGICLDVTEEVERHTELESARRRAEDLLRMKTSLLNNMSHELRTPLAGIRAIAETLADDLPTEQRELVQYIAQNAQRLNDTLDSVLDLAQLEGGVDLLPSTFDVVSEIQEAAAEFALRAANKGLQLQVITSPSLGKIHTDRTGLHRVLGNLIGNAVKFTDQGGITLEAEGDVSHVTIRVIDTGIGISSEFLPRIFDEFKQESTGWNRTHEGNGLGLTVVRRLVDLMGGTIEVESQKDQGSTFTLVLPRRAPMREVPVELASYSA